MFKPHYGYAKTESAVKRKLREHKKEVAKGNFETQDSYMLFQDYCLDWLNSVYKNKVVVTTFSERMRTVPFKSKAIEVIEKIIKIQQKLGITSNRISATLNDTYVSSTLFIYRINDLLKKIQSEKEIVSHGLRHTFVTLSADAGVPLNVVSNWVGHKNVEITQDYNHILKTQVDKGVALLENW